MLDKFTDTNFRQNHDEAGSSGGDVGVNGGGFTQIQEGT